MALLFWAISWENWLTPHTAHCHSENRPRGRWVKRPQMQADQAADGGLWPCRGYVWGLTGGGNKLLTTQTLSAAPRSRGS